MSDESELEWDENGRLAIVSEFQKPGPKRQAALQLVGVAKKEYWNPFDDYENVETFGGFAEHMYPEREDLRNHGAPHIHGLEIERDKGYIRIVEERPIIAAVVLGSGCAMPAYVVCEYPQPGITMQEPHRSKAWRGFNMQNVRRQRIDGMMSQHPSSAVRTYPQEIINYEMDYEPRVRECSARFEIEPTTVVTFRGGSGTSSHFSFRMIRLYFELER
jgi:hypothetical protein